MRLGTENVVICRGICMLSENLLPSMKIGALQLVLNHQSIHKFNYIIKEVHITRPDKTMFGYQETLQLNIILKQCNFVSSTVKNGFLKPPVNQFVRAFCISLFNQRLIQ